MNVSDVKTVYYYFSSWLLVVAFDLRGLFIFSQARLTGGDGIST